MDILHIWLQWQQKLWRSMHSWLQDQTSRLSLWSKILIMGHIAWFNSFIQANCPAGCPCDEFNCLETTTSADVSTSTAQITTTISTTTSTTTASPTPNAVLVLSTYKSENKPMVVTFEGKTSDIFPSFFWKIIFRCCEWRSWFRIWEWNWSVLWMWCDFKGAILVSWWKFK